MHGVRWPGLGMLGAWRGHGSVPRGGLGESRGQGDPVAVWKERVVLESTRKRSLASVGMGWRCVGGLLERVPWAQHPFGAL